jgi:SWI/SNF-related matrix-associated actin-dependent regulator 1 of chromatin subfamily A
VCKSAERLILLSGTPALSRPIELYSQISLVSPKLFRYVTEFGMRYCDGKKTSFGHDFTGSSNMPELNLLLQNTYVCLDFVCVSFDTELGSVSSSVVP